MNPNLVVIIDTGYDHYEYEKTLLQKSGFELKIFSGGRFDREGKIKFAMSAAGMLVRSTLVDRDFFEKMPNLRAVVRYGVGYDNIDIAAAIEFGVKVANVQGYANHAVSDHALALMFACARALPLGEKRLFTHYAVPPRKPLPEFKNLTLGIIGLGRIGGTLCQKATRLFREIVAADPYISDDRFRQLGAKKVEIGELLLTSDIISIHCNLTTETTSLIDKQQFAIMKQKPVLVNTARGPVIDPVALLEALENGTIHSAGLDVYCQEPPEGVEKVTTEHPNVISTGHYAWYSEDAAQELQKRAAENMLSLLLGQIPQDCLNPDCELRI